MAGLADEVDEVAAATGFSGAVRVDVDDAVLLEGYDAGVSFCSVHDPVRRLTYTVVPNWSEGAWPLARLLDGLLLP